MHWISGDQDGSGSGGGRSGARVQLVTVAEDGGGGRGAHRRTVLAHENEPCSTAAACCGQTGRIDGGGDGFFVVVLFACLWLWFLCVCVMTRKQCHT